MIDAESFQGDYVYLDSNVFIYAVEGFEKYAALCSIILDSIEEMRTHAITSELTLAEVLVLPLKEGNGTAVAKYEGLIKSQYDLKLIPISRDILREAARLRASTGIKIPDAIHVATALAHGAEFIFTADRGLRAPAPLRVVTLDELLDA
jgi:predicted nucleic acid-binding protein